MKDNNLYLYNILKKFNEQYREVYEKLKKENFNNYDDFVFEIICSMKETKKLIEKYIDKVEIEEGIEEWM